MKFAVLRRHINDNLYFRKDSLANLFMVSMVRSIIDLMLPVILLDKPCRLLLVIFSNYWRLRRLPVGRRDCLSTFPTLIDRSKFRLRGDDFVSFVVA